MYSIIPKKKLHSSNNEIYYLHSTCRSYTKREIELNRLPKTNGSKK